MDIHSIRIQLHTHSIYDIKMRVAYYARVSTDKEEQLNSLDNQVSFFNDFIGRNPLWELVDGYIDEGLSGMSTLKRENFHRMIDDARMGRFDLLVTKEISRFARNTLDSIKFTREMLSYGVGVFFLNDNINTLDEDSELRLTIMSGIAQDELRKLSSRIKFGHQQAINDNVVMGNSLIYGYKKDKKRLVIDENDAMIVRELFELYATDKYSMSQIEQIFWDKGYRNKRGNRISHATMSKLIANPKYKGYYVGNKVKVVDMFTKKQKFLPQEEWRMFKDETGELVPALVSEELWEQANRVLRERSLDVKHRRNVCTHGNILTGKLFCSACGAPYYRKDSRDIHRRENSSWVCSNKLKHGKDACASFRIYESEIKTILFDVFNMASTDAEDLIEKYIKVYKTQFAPVDIRSQIRDTEELIEVEKAKRMKAFERNLSGMISDEALSDISGICDENIRNLRNTIKELEQEEAGTKDFNATLDGLKALLRQAKKDVDGDFVTAEFIKKYVERIDVDSQDTQAKLTIILKTGEIAERYVSKTQRRTGTMVKKMIEAQEKSMSGK